MSRSLTRRVFLCAWGWMIFATGMVGGATNPTLIDYSEESAKYYKLSTFSTPIENPEKKGKKLLQINTQGTTSSVNCLRTLPGILKPDTDYQVKIRCKILEKDDKSALTVIVQPLNDTKNHFYKIVNATSSTEGVWEEIPLRFHVPPGINNYSLQILADKGQRILLDEIEIREEPFEKKESLLANRSSQGVTPQVISGSENFEIDLPKLKDSSESVVKFGADSRSLDNTKAFNDAIEYCAKNGISRLVVPKGTYRFTANVSVAFNNLKDFEFDGQGSKFIFLKEKTNLFEITNCERIQFKDFSMDWDWEQDPLASVVKVEKIDPALRYADFRFVDYKKFPKKDVRVAFMSGLNPKTKLPGIEKGLIASLNTSPTRGKDDKKTEWLEDNLLRVYTGENKTDYVKELTEGQFFRMQHYYYGVVAIYMISNRHLTLSGVNIHSVKGTAFAIGGEQHHWQFLNTNIAPPKGEKRPITCTSDHIHVMQSQGYFKMEGCEISLGGDDAINIHDSSGFARKTGDYTVKTVNLGGAFTLGDVFEFQNDDYSPIGFAAKVKAINPIDPSRKIYELTFESKLPEQKTSGFILFNQRFGSKNIIIRNCYFHDAPRIILLAKNMTLEKNRFENFASSTIKIETGYTLNKWSEGFGASNIIIRGNTFDHSNQIGRYMTERQPVICTSVYLKSDPSHEKTSYPIFQNILIEGNVFNEFPGTIAYLSSSKNVVIQNNKFSNTEERLENWPFRGDIAVAYSSQVFILNNEWSASPYMKAPSVILDSETTKDIYFSGNKLSSGAR